MKKDTNRTNTYLGKAASYTASEGVPVPFENVEELWFWFIVAQQARNEGARYVAGAGMVRRPCEPVDILKILDGLYRQRRLLRDHLLVLRHYGRRNMPPDPRRVKEKRAHVLWHEALERLSPILERKGIISKPKSWVEQYMPPFAGNDQFTLFTAEGVAAE